MSTSRNRLAASLAAAALTAGCASVGPDFVPPAPLAVSAYAQPAQMPASRVALGETLAADWWALFQSPEIDAVVREAQTNSPTLDAARERLAQAREYARAQASPLQGDLEATAAREHVNLAGFGVSAFQGIENRTVDLYSVAGSASYDFDLAGGGRRERESRAARLQAAEEELAAARLTLTGQVVEQALTIASLKAQLAANEGLVARYGDLLDLAMKANARGGNTRIDVSKARSARGTEVNVSRELVHQIAMARDTLALLTGHTPGEWTAPDFDLDRIATPGALPTTLPSELARARPDIRAAEARLHAAMAQVGVAESRLYPSLTLSANLTQTSLAPERVFSSEFSGWSIGPLGISLPILDRASRRAQARAAAAAARAVAADYRQTVLTAFVQVADALETIRRQEDEVHGQTVGLSNAKERVDLHALRYRAGKAGLEPLYEAQTDYQRSMLDYEKARGARNLGVARLFLATGGGWAAQARP